MVIMCKDLAMHRVVVLAMPNVFAFELGIPARIFGAARGPADERLYEVITCSLDGGPVTTSADFAVTVEHGVEVLETADTLVIPPFLWESTDLPAEVFGALRPGTRVVSICTAAVLL